MSHNAFAFPWEQVVKDLNSNMEKGLPPQEVKNRLARYGDNCLPVHVKKSNFKILLGQLDNPILYLLGLAAGLDFIFFGWLEGLTVCIVILITILIGFFMELSAVRSKSEEHTSELQSRENLVCRPL